MSREWKEHNLKSYSKRISLQRQEKETFSICATDVVLHNMNRKKGEKLYRFSMACFPGNKTLLRDGECYDFNFWAVSEAGRYYECIAVNIFTIPVGVHERCTSRNGCCWRSWQCLSRRIVNNWSRRRSPLRSRRSIYFRTGAISRATPRRSDALKSSRITVTSITIREWAVVVNETVRRFASHSSFTK